MSETRAKEQLRVVFQSYAEDSFWGHVQGNPVRVKRMENLVPDILNALILNGYDKKKVNNIFKTSLGEVRRRYNYEIANELQRSHGPRDAELEETLAKLSRIDGTRKTLQSSLEVSMASSLKTFTPEERKRQRESLRNAWRLLLQKRKQTSKETKVQP
jgi:hypothetical protein